LSNVPTNVNRHEVLDLRRHEFVDLLIPTIEVKRTAIARSVAIGGVIGSHRIGAGSIFRLTEIEVFSGTYNAIVGLCNTGTPVLPEQRGTSLFYQAPKVWGKGSLAPAGPNHQVYRWDNAPTFGTGTLNFKNVSNATGSPFMAVSFRGYEYSLNQGVSTV